jgi:glycosyltransferase involved in cell wall biosynthesis
MTRLLWAVGSWKRTGPVEPSLDLAAGLARRGHEVLVVTGRPDGDAPDEVAEAAEARGLPRLSAGLRLARHWAPLDNARDARLLARLLRTRSFDAVVSTLRNDHRILARASREAGGVPVARLWFADGASPPERGERDLLAGAGLVVAFGAAPRRALDAAGVDGARVVTVGPPLDVERLRRSAAGARRERGRGVPTFGIVARVQPHRRFDLLWDALARAVARGPALRLLVVGRGTRFDDLVTRPVAERGLDDVVVLAGYLRGAEYAATLASLDAQVFLVPGSDPTCRALREGMALGVPSVATRRGLLPDLVDDGVTGLLADETPDALAGAFVRLAGDPALRRRLGAAAAAKAEREFDAHAVAAQLGEALERVR